MPVPTTITDLSTTAASNYPQGTDSPSTLDDTQRAHGAFIRQLQTGAVTTTANVTAGTINGATVGATTPSTGSFTTLNSTGGALNGTVGATTPATGAFTTLSSTGNTTLGDASTDTVTVNGYMGVGGAPQSNVGIWLRNTLTSSANQYGILASITGASAATTQLYGFTSDITVPNAAFTYTDVADFRALPGIKGASATLTNKHGVYIADQTQGTNNYGITSGVSSGTNKWNIYASGTADNYFAGDVGVGTSAPSAKLHVEGATQGDIKLQKAGTAGVSLYSDAAGTLKIYDNAAAAIRATLDASGNLGLGVTPSAWDTTFKALQVGAIGGLNLGGASNDSFIGNNTYYNAGWKFSGGAGPATMMRQNNGAFTWYYSATGTGGTAITWSSPMTLDSAGNLGLGVTPSAWTSGIKVVELGNAGNALVGGLASNAWVVSNVIFDSGSTQKYAGTQAATGYQQYQGVHKWYTAPSGTAGTAITFTQSLSVGNGTTLALEGATSAAGTGIAFPATQVASSNANTLDDYEEGTFTPTIIGSTTAGVGTYTDQLGYYTKIGRVVNFHIVLNWTAHTGTGNMRVAGLPFTSANNNANDSWQAAVTAENLTFTAGSMLGAFVVPNAAQVYVREFSGTAAAYVAIDTSAVLRLSGHYEV